MKNKKLLKRGLALGLAVAMTFTMMPGVGTTTAEAGEIAIKTGYTTQDGTPEFTDTVGVYSAPERTKDGLLCVGYKEKAADVNKATTALADAMTGTNNSALGQSVSTGTCDQTMYVAWDISSESISDAAFYIVDAESDEVLNGGYKIKSENTKKYIAQTSFQSKDTAPSDDGWHLTNNNAYVTSKTTLNPDKYTMLFGGLDHVDNPQGKYYVYFIYWTNKVNDYQWLVDAMNKLQPTTNVSAQWSAFNTISQTYGGSAGSLEQYGVTVQCVEISIDKISVKAKKERLKETQEKNYEEDLGCYYEGDTVPLPLLDETNYDWGYDTDEDAGIFSNVAGDKEELTLPDGVGGNSHSVTITAITEIKGTLATKSTTAYTATISYQANIAGTLYGVATTTDYTGHLDQLVADYEKGSFGSTGFSVDIEKANAEYTHTIEDLSPDATYYIYSFLVAKDEGVTLYSEVNSVTMGTRSDDNLSGTVSYQIKSGENWVDYDLDAVRGNVEGNQTLKAIVTGAPNDATLSYQWYRLGTEDDAQEEEISGATNPTYAIQKEDIQKNINVKITDSRAAEVKYEGEIWNSDWLYVTPITLGTTKTTLTGLTRSYDSDKRYFETTLANNELKGLLDGDTTTTVKLTIYLRDKNDVGTYTASDIAEIDAEVLGSNKDYYMFGNVDFKNNLTEFAAEITKKTESRSVGVYATIGSGNTVTIGNVLETFGEYNGAATVTATDGTKLSNISLDVEKGELTCTVASDAAARGTENVVFDGLSFGNYTVNLTATVTFTEAAVAEIEVQDLDKDYDGAVVVPTVTVSSNNKDITNTVAAVCEYKKIDGTSLQTAPKDAGAYSLTITFDNTSSDSETKAIGSKTVFFTIRKTTATVKVKSAKITVGGTYSSAYTVEGLVGEDTLSSIGVTSIGDPIYQTFLGTTEPQYYNWTEPGANGATNYYVNMEGAVSTFPAGTYRIVYSPEIDDSTLEASNYYFDIDYGTLTVEASGQGSGSNVAPAGTSGAGGGSSTPATNNDTKTDTKTNADGSTTTTETKTNSDGSTTETATTTNTDGSKVESTTTTKTDATTGTTTETAKETMTDASGNVTQVTESTTTTYTDGSSEEVKTVTNADGSGEVSQTTTQANGASESTTVATDSTGAATSVSTESTNKNGKTTEAEYDVTSGTNITLENVDTTTNKIEVPATVKAADGKTYKVTEIAKNAAKGNKTAKQVTVGANVKKIGASAFANCAKVTKATIGKNVTSIAKNTFKGDGKLKTITLQGAKVTSVGKNAFSGIAKNATITISGTAKQVKKVTNLIKKSGVAKTVTIKRAK